MIEPVLAAIELSHELLGFVFLLRIVVAKLFDHATITRGALSPNGSELYTADPTSNFVHRIDLTTGERSALRTQSLAIYRVKRVGG